MIQAEIHQNDGSNKTENGECFIIFSNKFSMFNFKTLSQGVFLRIMLSRQQVLVIH